MIGNTQHAAFAWFVVCIFQQLSLLFPLAVVGVISCRLTRKRLLSLQLPCARSHTSVYMCFYICNVSPPLQSAARRFCRDAGGRLGETGTNNCHSQFRSRHRKPNYSFNGYGVCLNLNPPPPFSLNLILKYILIPRHTLY